MSSISRTAQTAFQSKFRITGLTSLGAAIAITLSMYAPAQADSVSSLNGKAETFVADCEWRPGGPNPEFVTGFKTNSAHVPKDQELDIKKFAKNADHFDRICVIGQADKRGRYEMNDKLAMKRARAVAARLIAAGIDPANLVLSSRAEAYGDGLPDWFWFNGSRRVEIIPIK